MGIDRKYGQVITEHGHIPLDEPVFVLRARDKLSVQAIAHYMQLAEEAGSPERHVAMAAGTATVFQEWQDAHPDQVRTPDSERSRAWMEK